MADIKGDNEAAVEFLRKWPARPVVLSAVDPERKKGMLTYRCTTEKDIRQVLELWNGKRNLYFTVNCAEGFEHPKEPGKWNKPKKEHMQRMVALHVDIDPVDGADIDAQQAEILGKLGAYSKPPSVIIFSGGGYQGFWLLREPVPITNADELEAYNRRIEKDLVGDHCYNIDRIMRLPGTVNLPDAKKRAKGRVQALATVVQADWQLVYGLDDFTPWAEAAGAGKPRGAAKEKSDPGWVERVLANGPDASGPHSYGGDRSRAVWAVVCALARKKWSVEQIEAALLDKNNALSGHIYDQNDPERAAKRQATKAVEEAFTGVSVEDFWAYMPNHSYIFTPTSEMWPAGSVNTRVGKVGLFDDDGRPRIDEKTGEQATVSASMWLDWNKPVEQMTWAPGEGVVIKDRLIADGGWFERSGTTCFNQYRPPTITHGDAAQAQRWIDHVAHVYPDDAGHIIRYFAQRVQQPANKINHGLVLGGEPGIGKDTLLEPLKQAVGAWNFADITPQHLLGRFNGFAKSVVLRISEARDLEINQYQFYEHTKIYMASPPDVLRVDEKHLREHAVVNCCGVIITSNHKTNGIYLPANDRRHYVAWSNLTESDFDESYWNDMWQWYHGGGFGHVAAYLATADLSDFDPKRPPPKTDAFWAIVQANNVPEGSELAQVLEDMGVPAAVTIDGVAFKASEEFRGWLRDRKNRRQLPHRFEECGYMVVRNRDVKDGLWKLNGKRQVAYARAELAVQDQLKAVAALGTSGFSYGENAQADIPFE
jgi:hypothetical protein